jgi:hypothetical protein
MIVTLVLFTAALLWFTRSSWVSKIPGETRTVVVETSPRESQDPECRSCDVSARKEAVGGEYRWNGSLAAGQVLEVKGISGSVHAMRASGDRFEVVATKHGRRSDFDEVEIDMVEHADGVTVCALYPGRRGRTASCESGDSNNGNMRDLDVEVEFEVHVPAGVNFVGRSVSGDVEAVGLSGDVEAFSVSGDIDITTSGIAQGSTVSGDISVTMGRGTWDGTLEFHTVSGDVDIALPQDLRADVFFESLSGELQSDFAITMEGRRSQFIGQNIRGTIGGGGGSLSLKSVSGDVNVTRR